MLVYIVLSRTIFGSIANIIGVYADYEKARNIMIKNTLSFIEIKWMEI